MSYLFILLVSLVLAFRWPVVTWALLTFVLEMAIFRRQFNDSATLFLAKSALLLAGLRSLLDLVRMRQVGTATRRMIWVSTIALGLPLWCMFAGLMSGIPIKNLLIAGGLDNQGSGIVIALRAYRSRGAQRIFLGVIIVHLFLSLLVIFQPHSMWGSLSEGSDAAIMKSTASNSSSDVVKNSGHFYNPVQLGVLGGLTVFLGALVFTAAGPKKKFYGLALCSVGVLVCYLAMMRGAIVATLAGLLCWGLRGRKAAWGIGVALVLCISIGFLVQSGALFLDDIPSLRFIQRAFSPDDGGNAYRIEAIHRLPGYVLESPIYGLGGYERSGTLNSPLPHQYVLSIAVLYGVPAAVLVVMLTMPLIFCVMGSIGIGGRQAAIRMAKSNTAVFTARQLGFIHGCAWVTLVVLFTNGSSGNALGLLMWTMWGIAILPWSLADVRRLHPSSSPGRHNVELPPGSAGTGERRQRVVME